MDTNDKQHIEAICRRHDIHFLCYEEAVLLLASRGQLKSNLAADGTLISFSSRLYNTKTGREDLRSIYISPQDARDDIYELDMPINEDEHEYFVALHELGHIMLRHQGSKVAPLWRQCEEEIEAWEWAFAHAQYWPSEAVEIAALNACSTYTHREDAMLRGEIQDDPEERLRPYRPEINSVAA